MRMLCSCDSTFVQKIITNIDKNFPLLFAVKFFNRSHSPSGEQHFVPEL